MKNWAGWVVHLFTAKKAPLEAPNALLVDSSMVSEYRLNDGSVWEAAKHEWNATRRNEGCVIHIDFAHLDQLLLKGMDIDGGSTMSLAETVCSGISFLNAFPEWMQSEEAFVAGLDNNVHLLNELVGRGSKVAQTMDADFKGRVVDVLRRKNLHEAANHFDNRERLDQSTAPAQLASRSRRL